MRITDVVPLVMGTSWRNLIFLKVLTDEGLIGIGEATLHNREEGVLGYLEGAKRRHIVGSDPFNIEDLWMRMYRNDFWRHGDIALTVLSGVEIACWDILGKAVGRPVWQLLGGRCHETLPAYANGWYTVARDPAEFAAAAKKVTAQGYKALKVDPFGAGLYELSQAEKRRSIELVEAVRGAVGDDVEIFIEAHGRFGVRTAIDMARALEPFHPGWFEEPVPPENMDALKAAYDRINIPVATGERFYTRYDYHRLFQVPRCDIIQPDVIHCGGLLETKKIAAMADANYVTVAPHNSEGPVTTAATLHLNVTLTNFKIQENFDDFVEPWVKQAVPGAPECRNGYFEPPTAPGLGIRLNEDLIKEHPYKPGFFNLFAEDWQRRQFLGNQPNGSERV